jgi:putative transposase
MNELYQNIGISKQGVHAYAQRQKVLDNQLENLVLRVDKLRKQHPGCGVESMYYKLEPDFIGRDKFIDVFMKLGYRIKRKRNYYRTTYSSNHYYPNLIEGMKINAPSTVWQSDITYIKVGDRFYYAVFIIDVYTRKIVGHKVSDHMRATANIEALQLALKSHEAPQVHHSDRGSQYTYSDYVSTLKKLGTKISMGLCAQDNAYAERINRTVKEEFIDYWKPRNYIHLVRSVSKAVNYYNQERNHSNLNRQSPNEFIAHWNKLNDDDRPILTIFDNNYLFKPVNLI